MLAACFQVLDWAAQAEGRAHQAAWREWAGAPASTATPPLERPGLPMLLRRRLTPLGQSAIAAAYQAGAAAGLHYIFASRHGEFRRSLRLLQSLAQGEALSPADFSLSVHNALAGLLSIATGARAGHTALAAGADSFAAGLVEAAALLAAQPAARVLLVYFDDDLPPPFDSLAPGPPAGPLALALLLAAPQPQGGGEAVAFSAQAEPGAPALPTTAQAEAFLRFLASGQAAAVAPGGRLRLEWRRAA